MGLFETLGVYYHCLSNMHQTLREGRFIRDAKHRDELTERIRRCEETIALLLSTVRGGVA